MEESTGITHKYDLTGRAHRSLERRQHLDIRIYNLFYHGAIYQYSISVLAVNAANNALVVSWANVPFYALRKK